MIVNVIDVGSPQLTQSEQLQPHSTERVSVSSPFVPISTPSGVTLACGPSAGSAGQDTRRDLSYDPHARLNVESRSEHRYCE